MTGRLGIVGTISGIDTGGRGGGTTLGATCGSTTGMGGVTGITGRRGSGIGSRSKVGAGGSGNIVGTGFGGTTAGLVITGRLGSDTGCRFGGVGGVGGGSG